MAVEFDLTEEERREVGERFITDFNINLADEGNAVAESYEEYKTLKASLARWSQLNSWLKHWRDLTKRHLDKAVKSVQEMHEHESTTVAEKRILESFVDYARGIFDAQQRATKIIERIEKERDKIAERCLFSSETHLTEAGER